MAAEMRKMVRQPSRESTDGSINSYSSEGNLIFPGVRLGADSQFSDFLDGLGPAQLVGRQTLATPAMGDIQIGMEDKKGQLEVEVIRARSLTQKPGSKSTPAPYVKVYLLENGACIAKKKTRIARKTLDPLYQQSLVFDESPQGKVLQVIVWGDYGRMDHKCFMGVAQILLEELDLSSMKLEAQCMDWCMGGVPQLGLCPLAIRDSLEGRSSAEAAGTEEEPQTGPGTAPLPLIPACCVWCCHLVVLPWRRERLQLLRLHSPAVSLAFG
ncbi:Regulating synaptic membrane exocytosis protein 1 [Myotis davidii]|uniref:Regulating synaptic membrane exocytosis protein 1 n=1 Tax=Myotis davidii TaxID=225400 RepID=L5LCY5_MYODS|nr:Regulating synaptic membrane exocytosis protein 1 [Myotis davidii]